MTWLKSLRMVLMLTLLVLIVGVLIYGPIFLGVWLAREVSGAVGSAVAVALFIGAMATVIWVVTNPTMFNKWIKKIGG